MATLTYWRLIYTTYSIQIVDISYSADKHTHTHTQGWCVGSGCALVLPPGQPPSLTPACPPPLPCGGLWGNVAVGVGSASSAAVQGAVSPWGERGGLLSWVPHGLWVFAPAFTSPSPCSYSCFFWGAVRGPLWMAWISILDHITINTGHQSRGMNYTLITPE